MTKAIRIHQLGGPDVLQFEEVELPNLGPGDALLQATAIGVNMKEIGERQGAYPTSALPTIPGIEGTAIVLDVGSNVKELKAGDRVCYATMPTGSYAERRVLSADRLIRLPDDISDEVAAAAIHKGITARYLVRKTHRVCPDDTILVHAAAGATGSLLCQWAKSLGATVIGTVGNSFKSAYAIRNGCDHVLEYVSENFVERVRDITNGRGVDVVYDSIGQATVENSLACLQPLGLLVLYGIASGKPPPIQIMNFDIWKAPFYTRPSFFVHTRERKDLLACAQDVFEAIRTDTIRVDIAARFRLKDAASAHRAVEARSTMGSVILIP